MFDQSQPTNNQSSAPGGPPPAGGPPKPAGPQPVPPAGESTFPKPAGPKPIPPATPAERGEPAPPQVPIDSEPTVMPRISEKTVDGVQSAPKAPPPLNLPDIETTEDIFKETDQASPIPGTAGTPPPGGPLEPLTELPDDLEEEGGGGKKFFLVGIIVVVIILAGGAYYAYSKFFAPPAEVPEVNLNTQPQVNENVNVEVNENENINFNENVNEDVTQECPTIMPQGPNFCKDGKIVTGDLDENGCSLPPKCVKTKSTLDSDKDGLTDAEEEEYGTDSFAPDSDGDGLYDREEIKVYNTNPLNPDTDNDGYLDGEEVENGYNPAGEGKLLEVDEID